MATPNISFKPKQVVKRLLASLSDRAHEIIVFRYGLGKDERRLTLDAIGKKYGITRERVRQIEAYALDVIRKSDEYVKEKAAFTEIETLLPLIGRRGRRR
jgi:DNA-directed RNA polymerase sigma subunit (sigma70/sigma32)